MPILLLAVVGTLIGTILVGGIVSSVLDVPLLAAFAFGALISATDPVAVIAFFRSLGVSKRLSVLVEGESLFNDGVAIVLFNLALAFAASTVDPLAGGWATAASAVGEFLRVALGGLGVGLVLGYVVSYIILKNVDDHLIETTTTVALAFGSFVLAEQFHMSGILAVVAAGLMVGNLGMRNTSPTTRLTLDNFWEFSAFIANSIIFLLIGLEIELIELVPYWIPILVAVVAVLVVRALLVYSFAGVYSRFAPSRLKIPMNYRHIMFWGGLRGAISLALALTLTTSTIASEFARELQVMTFGVVLFTLLVQGMSIEGLIRRLGLANKPEALVAQQERQAQLFVKRAGQRELKRLYEEGLIYRSAYEAMDAVYSAEIQTSKRAVSDHLERYPDLEQDMFLQVRADLLSAERAALGEALGAGFLSEDTYEEMVRDINDRMAALDVIKESRLTHSEMNQS